MQFNKEIPIYLQIKEVIYNTILSGTYENGERIPSIRDMAITLEVNPNTVTRAYGLLQDEEVIENQRGIGYFTSVKAKEIVSKRKREEFLHKDVPLFFETMEKLDLSIDEIMLAYQTTHNKKDTIENEKK
ncbi:MAG: GntR family transcriptional regulator [Spirochaetia bacterium]|nr:GntR family transcriptional regulator [Spirochaetia bacterium]